MQKAHPGLFRPSLGPYGKSQTLYWALALPLMHPTSINASPIYT